MGHLKRPRLDEERHQEYQRAHPLRGCDTALLSDESGVESDQQVAYVVGGDSPNGPMTPWHVRGHRVTWPSSAATKQLACAFWIDTPIEKMMLALANFAAEVERDRARQRTFDAMLRRAKSLWVAGGKVSYDDNLDAFAETPGPDGRRQRVCVVRVITPEQAAVIRRIFRFCPEGKGIRRIAKALNAERVAPPRRARGWATTAIREMLHRSLYMGEILWNKTHTVVRGGTNEQVDRPKEAWITIPAPDLQIVSDDLWKAARADWSRPGMSSLVF